MIDLDKFLFVTLILIGWEEGSSLASRSPSFKIVTRFSSETFLDCKCINY